MASVISTLYFYTSTHVLPVYNFLLGGVSFLFSLRVPTRADDISAAAEILTVRVAVTRLVRESPCSKKPP